MHRLIYLFASRRADLLTERMPAAATGGHPGGSRSLTPAVFNHLPAKIKDLLVSSYNDALTPIFIWMDPLAVIAAVLFFIKERPLATAIEHDVLSESISEGNILITAADEPAAAPQCHGGLRRFRWGTAPSQGVKGSGSSWSPPPKILPRRGEFAVVQ